MTTRHHDPGLQPERTSLSWTRTIGSLLICSLTMLRWAFAYPEAIAVQIFVMVLLATALMTTQYRRYRRYDIGLARESLPPNVGPVLLVAAALIVFAVSELVLICVSAALG